MKIHYRWRFSAIASFQVSQNEARRQCITMTASLMALVISTRSGILAFTNGRNTTNNANDFTTQVILENSAGNEQTGYSDGCSARHACPIVMACQTFSHPDCGGGHPGLVDFWVGKLYSIKDEPPLSLAMEGASHRVHHPVGWYRHHGFPEPGCFLRGIF